MKRSWHRFPLAGVLVWALAFASFGLCGFGAWGHGVAQAAEPQARRLPPMLPDAVRVGVATDLAEVVLPRSLGPARLQTRRHLLEIESGATIRPGGKLIGLSHRVQVAALKDERQAQSLAESLEGRFSVDADAVFDAETDLYKVRLGRFDDRASADSLLAQLRGLGYTESWVTREAEGLEQAGFLVDVGSKTYRLDGRRLAVSSPSDLVTWSGKTFRGGLDVFFNDRGKFNLINRVDLEDYLRGVVPKELGPAQYPHLEALKAQAVAARTYTMRNLGEFALEGYDICATPRCQVYGGRAMEHPLSDRAIRETQGQVLLFRGALAETLYSATCGGHTEDASVVFPEKDHEYLRGVPCIESGRQAGAPSDLALASQLMPEVLPSAQTEPIRRLEDRLRSLALRAGLPAPEDRLASLEAREVRRFVASIFDLVVDARIFADSVELRELVEEPPSGWSGEDRGLANYFNAGWVSVRERGHLTADEGEELLYQLALFVRLLEIDHGHFQSRDGEALRLRRDPDPTARAVVPSEVELELAKSTPFFRRFGASLRSERADLRSGDPLEVIRLGDRAVAVIQAAAGLPTSGQRRGRSPWSRFRSDQRLAGLVREKHPGFTPERLEVLSRGVSGRVRELALDGQRDGQKERIVVRGLAVRWLVDVPDTLFTVQRVTPRDRSSGWLFKGRGWGHGVGMCQIGAVLMAQEGTAYEQILHHYYSDIEIRTLAPPAPSSPSR
ncbi:MAG: SpoIID/LytB domain-containing protein [Acidobacteriota bacterium]